MKLSKEQLKGRLKNVANRNNADARVLTVLKGYCRMWEIVQRSLIIGKDIEKSINTLEIFLLRKLLRAVKYYVE